MDRQIIYSGQVPQTTDLLNTNKQAMIALAKLCSDLFGTANLVSGLGCVPTSPASMSVNINPGQIYQLVNVDGTAYSAVPADTTHSILKQGILMDAQSFALTAPGTVGYSQNYLIQAAYLDNDINSTVLPYYNSANPTQAFNGPGGNGTAQATTRAGQVSLQLVAGTAAATGTQTTPAVTTGYVGIAVITVANGQSTITAGNISAYPNLVNAPTGGFLAAVGERFSGIQTVTASTTLTTAALGALVNVTATGQTVTLPPAANCPNGTSICVVYMQSSGSTTVTRNGTDTLAFSQGGSATSLTLNPGEEVQFVSNGTNGWVSAGQTQNGLHAVLNTINANTTLTAANMGQSIPIFGAGGITVTLPAVSATTGGQRLEFFNYSAGTVTVASAGSDVITPYGVSSQTSFALNSGDTLVLESLGASGVWYAVGGSVQLPYSKAFTTATSGVVGATRNLAMSVATVSTSATLTADEIIVEASLGGFRYCLANFSKTINLATTGAGGMDTGSAPTSGFVALYAIYNPTTGASALLGVNATSAAAPSVYGGANMPSNYTASALVSVWPTDASNRFVQGRQVDRKIWTTAGTALSTSTQQASATVLSISGLVPANAKTVGGIITISSSTSTTLTSTIGGGVNLFGQQNCQGQTVLSLSTNYEVPMLSSQQVYYTATALAGTMTFSVYVTSYTI